MSILTYEQIEALNYKECKSALKLLFKTYRMETSWYDLTKEERDLCDDIGNTLLWLEDRIYRFEDVRVPSMNPNMEIVRSVKKKPDPALAKRPARKYRIGDVIYKDVHEAAMKTGIKVGTLRTYVGRNPDRYGYVDS